MELEKRIRWCFLTGFILFFSELWIPEYLTAQDHEVLSPGITFAQQTYNFGIIPEEGGIVNHRFEFKNDGGAPLVVTRVTTDCGCTTPTFTHESIAPGAEGFIEVTFDPEGRPGVFVKNILVYTNVIAEPIKLQITGNVTIKGNLDSRSERFSIGDLWLSGNFLTFPAMSGSRSNVIRLSLYNRGELPLSVTLYNPSHLFSLSESELTLNPQQVAEIKLTSSLFEDLVPGIYLEKIIVTAKAKRRRGLSDTIMVKLPVAPIFSEGFIDNAPKAKFVTYHDLGKIASPNPISGTIEIKNIGKSPLILHDVYCPNREISFNIKEKQASEGESIILNYRIDGEQLIKFKKEFDENVDLILNDPSAPYRRVKIRLTTT